MEKENIELLSSYMSEEAGYSQTDICYIKNAYETARCLHEATGHNDEQLKEQCLHLIYTARTLAELRLDANTIAAALMHDLLYTCNIDSEVLKQTFPETVIMYLEGMKEFHNTTMAYLRGDLTQSTKDLLKRPINNHVILISAAKRIDRLNEFAHVREEERPYYLDNTNDLLKRLVQKEGSIYLSDQLSECWLRCKAFYDTVKDPCDYSNYIEKYKKLLWNNKPSTEETIALLKDVFAGKAKDMSSDTIKHTKQIKEVHFSERLISNIVKHIKKDEAQGATQPFSKWSVPLYDITLIFNNSVGSTRLLIDEFMYIFQYYLRNHFFTIKDYLLTNDHVPYFVIADRWENRYRIFLRTMLLFRKYLIGDIADEEYSTQSSLYHSSNKGTVHIIINNHRDYYFPAGYSSLDYAFMINKNDGLNFEKMVINDSVTDTIGNAKLNEKDIGELFLSNHVTADLSWFNYIETVSARIQLIEYFKRIIG